MVAKKEEDVHVLNLAHIKFSDSLPRGFSEGHPVVFCGDMLSYVTQSFLLASSIFGLD